MINIFVYLQPKRCAYIKGSLLCLHLQNVVPTLDIVVVPTFRKRCAYNVNCRHNIYIYEKEKGIRNIIPTIQNPNPLKAEFKIVHINSSH